MSMKLEECLMINKSIGVFDSTSSCKDIWVTYKFSCFS